MRIAITGASGFIGSHLQRSLEADGHTVLPVSRSAGAPGTVRWDPAAGELDATALEGLDGIVHLAGEGIADKRWTPARKAAILESRRAGTTLLAGALASLSEKPPVLVSGSAIGFYGDRGDEELTEASGPGDDYLAEICTTWEAATAAAEEAGIRVAHIRTGIVLGAGGALGKMLPLFKLGVGGRLGPGTQWMSWVALADEVAAIRFLLEHPVRGPVNLTAPNPVTNREFTKVLGSVVHRPTLLPVPKFGPKLLLGGELAELLLFASQRVLPSALLEAGYQFRHPTLESALRDLVEAR
ncbi:MAG: TIGR01777 family oxidoreductase [Actinomycetota bacterium]|nr:TIGR01777 family oxidoreductase [Actinomycetota bacterium]